MQEYVEQTSELIKKLRNTFGVVMLKPDAIDEGVEDYLIDHIYKKLREQIPDIELAGVIANESFREDQTEKIYPNLNESYLKGMKTLLKNNQTMVVFFTSRSGDQDVWSLLRNIRGKIGTGLGMENSIRSIIPLPGKVEKFKKLSQKIKEDKLSEEDYIELCKGLVHVPDDEKEVAGILSSLDRTELINIFGSKKTTELLSIK